MICRGLMGIRIYKSLLGIEIQKFVGMFVSKLAKVAEPNKTEI